MEPYLSDHINKSVTVSRSQLHIFHTYVWCDTSIVRAKTFLYIKRQRLAGQFHHGNATNAADQINVFIVFLFPSCWLSSL